MLAMLSEPSWSKATSKNIVSTGGGFGLRLLEISMTVILIDKPEKFTGLSTDSKPTPNERGSGSEFFETDTGITYIWNGSTWKLYKFRQGSDFLTEVAKGNIPGHAAVNKFGRATTGIQTTATDIWDRADATPTQQIWTAPTQSRIHEIVSSSDADSDSGGTVAQGEGARTIRIFGLTAWDVAESSEDIIMDGTATGANSVDTANPYVIIYRMKVLTHGTSGPNVGIIRAEAKTDGTTTAQINAGIGQTQMAIYGIPSTQKAYMIGFDVNAHNTGNPSTVIETDFTMLINEHPDVDETPAAFLVKSNVGLIAAGSTAFPKIYDPAREIPGPAIIKFQGKSTTADTEGVAEFDLILVDN